MHRLPHLGLNNSATGPISSCRNGIWGLLQALTGPQMRFPFPVFLQGPSVKGTPQEEAGRERRCRKWPMGLNWGHANKMQIPPSSHFPSSPRHPHPAVKHGVISLRNTELQRTRGGVGWGLGGEPRKEELISASSCKSFGQSLKVQSRTNSAPCANSKLKAFRKEEGAERREIEWISFSKNQN